MCIVQRSEVFLLEGESDLAARHAPHWPESSLPLFLFCTNYSLFIHNKTLLSLSEWNNALKLNINYVPLCNIPSLLGACDKGPLSSCARQFSWSVLLVTQQHLLYTFSINGIFLNTIYYITFVTLYYIAFPLYVSSSQNVL